jgi:cell division protein FtsQ
MARAFQPPLPTALPGDVRLMNAVASTVFVGVTLALLAAGVQWLTRAPLFGIRAIQLDGELTRNSVATIRANAAPRLVGNFFSVDLQQGQAAFEAVPWVRRAVVRRVWPNRLAVQLEEHRAAALWEGPHEEAGNERMVNSHGEVFEANVGDVEEDDLPLLSGPENSAAQVLAMYQRVLPAFKGLQLGMERMHLSGRGSWRVQLDSGARIELGRGTQDEVAARTERFVRTLAQLKSHWPQPLEYADLRHADGYAVRLRGVTTTQPVAPQAKHN